MEEIKLSDGIIEQIKNFKHKYLTEEQKLLVDKLILNEELNERYKEYGLCKECKQPNTGRWGWCQSCNSKHFQQNFENWTSENRDIDEFIQRTQLKAKNDGEALEWIEYDRFENIEYLAKGGFGTTYKAIWEDGNIESWDSENNQWERYKHGKKDFIVALKCLHNSQDIPVKFLREIESYIPINNSGYITQCYGITRDSKTNNFIIVMEYAKYGSLRQYLNNHFNSLNWKDKLFNLYSVVNCLGQIHNNELIHRNFHCGNVLNYYIDETRVTDLGLYRPANAKPSQSDGKKVYGVLPYVAPEVLRGKDYTQASDIYGFGIIAYEVCTGLPPYHDIAHDESLVIRICQGLRPKSNYKVPQLILDIIQQCWNVDHLNRPKAEKLSELLWSLYCDANEVLVTYEENSIINKQIKEADKINKQLNSTGILTYTTHSQAIYTSRLLDFKNILEQKNAD